MIRMMRDGQGQAAQIMPIQQAIAHTDDILASEFRPAPGRRRNPRLAGPCAGFAGIRGGGQKFGPHLLCARAPNAMAMPSKALRPTSRAARQLRDAGIPSDTLQGFLARGQQAGTDPNSRHLYMVDEASLAGTRQMREFLTKIGPQDRVLLIGDTRQHQGVEAGKPFEQLVEAGMRTAQLDQIMRQKDPELKAVVERLAHGDVAAGIDLLQQQGRVTEIADPAARIQAIARDYAANPDRTLIVSPDNASRREINDAVRHELQARGMVNVQDHSLRVLVPRQELTGAERAMGLALRVGRRDPLRARQPG